MRVLNGLKLQAQLNLRNKEAVDLEAKVQKQSDQLRAAEKEVEEHRTEASKVREEFTRANQEFDTTTQEHTLLVTHASSHRSPFTSPFTTSLITRHLSLITSLSRLPLRVSTYFTFISPVQLLSLLVANFPSISLAIAILPSNPLIAITIFLLEDFITFRIAVSHLTHYLN